MSGERIENSGDTVCMLLSDLMLYCKEELDGMKLHLRTIHKEDGVKLSGRRPDTIISAVTTVPPDLSPPQVESLPPGLSPPQVESLPPGLSRPQVESLPPGLSRPQAISTSSEVQESTSNITVDINQLTIDFWNPRITLHFRGGMCPLTLDVFKDPVIIRDGHTYERAAIQSWLERNHKSPLTDEVIPRDDPLIPNLTMRKEISRLGGTCI